MVKTEVNDWRNRRVRVLVGLIVLGGLGIQCLRGLNGRPQPPSPAVAQEPVKPGPRLAFASVAAERPRTVDLLEERAARDPLGFLEEAVDKYDRTVRDYTCTFTKQELIGGKLTDEQVMHAMFREKPFSVRLRWTKNADKAARVLYVADRWVKEDQQMAVVDPAGAIARLFVSYVERPIHGPEARKTSRRTLDQFGLRNSLVLILKYARLAQEKGLLQFSYQGKSEVDGRPTLVFERRLPYTGEDDLWPDRVLVVHVDKELLLPTLCLCYADEEKKVLLGKYMNTDIKLNVNLPDSVFTKKGMGL